MYGISCLQFRSRVDPGYGIRVTIIGAEAQWLLACATCFMVVVGQCNLCEVLRTEDILHAKGIVSVEASMKFF